MCLLKLCFPFAVKPYRHIPRNCIERNAGGEDYKYIRACDFGGIFRYVVFRQRLNGKDTRAKYAYRNIINYASFFYAVFKHKGHNQGRCD